MDTNETESKPSFFGTLEQAMKFIAKYGATPVLATWLWVSNGRISALESKLDDCYKSSNYVKPIGLVPSVKKQIIFAVLPQKQKLIESENA